MTVATLHLVLLVSGCQSDREKRKRMRAIMGKLHRHFNVSVVDIDCTEDPREAKLVIAAVGRSRREVRRLLSRVADAVAVYPRAELVDQTIFEM